jgi:hypothetical protein
MIGPQPELEAPDEPKKGLEDQPQWTTSRPMSLTRRTGTPQASFFSISPDPFD